MINPTDSLNLSNNLIFQSKAKLILLHQLQRILEYNSMNHQFLVNQLVSMQFTH